MNFVTSEILQSSEIVAKLKQAWQDSEPNVSGGHEEGGFIVVDDFGLLSDVRWQKGTQNEIILPSHPNCSVEGRAIIASFHTHPNTGADFQQEPSLTDVSAIRDDPDLKGEFYLGEFIISQDNVYLIEPSGQISVIGKTGEVLER
jgi:hypothetical protein